MTPMDQPNTPNRNDVYYLEPVIFQVDDQLFKVPRYHFERYSEIFVSMFSLPQVPGSNHEGSTDSAPLKLEGVNKGDFQTLLGVMYPLKAMTTSWNNMTGSEWLSVLKLATMWTFKEIRALAIDKLTKEAMGPIEQVVAAKQYNVPQLLRSGCQALVARNEMLSVEEAGQLGYLTAILIFQVREQVRGANRHSYNYVNMHDVSSIIEREFEQELQEMEIVYAQYLP